MAFPDTEAAAVLDFVTGRGSTTIYLAMLTADPGSGATMATLSEDTTAGYARQQMVPSVPTGSPPVTGNSSNVVFGPFTAAQANPITHVAIVTSSSGTTGNVRWIQPLDTPFQAASGDSFTVPANAFTLSFLG